MAGQRKCALHGPDTAGLRQQRTPTRRDQAASSMRDTDLHGPDTAAAASDSSAPPHVATKRRDARITRCADTVPNCSFYISHLIGMGMLPL